MTIDLTELIPVTKFETEKASALVQLGFPAVEPVMPQILEWVQDLNWPVGHVFQPFLARIGQPLAPYIRAILAGQDDCWKYSLLQAVVGQSAELARALRPELIGIPLFSGVRSRRGSASLRSCVGVGLGVGLLALGVAMFLIGGPQFHAPKIFPYAAFAALAGMLGGAVFWVLAGSGPRSGAGPNPSIERTAKGLRPSSAAHVER
jgi:hypothetical protein